jgi:O-antigen/teichoic acid export membrane protein
MKTRLEQLANATRQQWRLAGVRNLVGGGVTGIAVTLANRVILLGSAVILARILGPEGYGIYAFAIALMAILSLGTEFGMYSLLVREVSVAHSNGDDGTLVGLRNNAFRFALVSSAIIGILGSAVIWTTPLVSDLNERITLTLILLILPANTLIRLSTAILNGLRRLAWAQVVELFLLPAMVFGGLLILVAIKKKDVSPALPMSMYLVSAMIIATLVLLLIHRLINKPNSAKIVERRVIGLQARARPFLLIGAAGVITGQLDTVFVGIFLENSEIALYRVAAQGATLIWFGIQILQSISAPYFARLHSSGDYQSLKRLFKWSTILSILSSLPIFIIFILFGGRIIEFAFGKEYADAHSLLIILSVGYTINASCGPIGSILIMIGREYFVSRVLMVTSAINILMALVLIQLVGVTGVAISTAFSIALYHVVLRIYGCRHCGI